MNPNKIDKSSIFPPQRLRSGWRLGDSTEVVVRVRGPGTESGLQNEWMMCIMDFPWFVCTQG